MKKYTAIGFSIIIFFSVFLVPLVSSVAFAGGEKLVACDNPPDCTFDDLIKTIENVVQFLVILATSIATIIIAWAGFLYLTAAGNSSKISQAHNLIWKAVVGFLIVLAAWLIVEVILDSLEAKDFAKIQSSGSN